MCQMSLIIALFLGNIYICCGFPSRNQPSVYRNTYNITNNASIENASGGLVTKTSTRNATFFNSSKRGLSHPFHMPAAKYSDITLISEELMTSAASDGIYPSFLRNSRHYLQPSDEDRFKPTAMRGKISEQSLLGSGDFGVLKGGTFYQDSDQPIGTYEIYGINYKSHNGHQRPFSSPLRQKIHYPTDSSDPFSNFRDFADINISNDGGQYSEFHVVFSNGNSMSSNQSNKTVLPNKSAKVESNNQHNRINRKLTEVSKKIVKLVKSVRQPQKQFESRYHIPKKNSEETKGTETVDSESDIMLALS